MGADFIPTLILSILAHIIINNTAIFNIENSLSLYIIPLLTILISIGYALYLYKPLKVKNDKGLN